MLQRMADAAKFLEGKHDFSSFMASGSKVTDAQRTVFKTNVVRDSDVICFYICADGFLYNMVRIICGTLLEIGKGSVAPEQIPDIIVSKNRQNAGPTLPACGLYLVGVNYPD
jgi:tRNA pseudouridine38-40 synthase